MRSVYLQMAISFVYFSNIFFSIKQCCWKRWGSVINGDPNKSQYGGQCDQIGRFIALFNPSFCSSFFDGKCFASMGIKPGGFSAVWPDWAIYCTLGNILKPLVTIICPNFCYGVKSVIFLVKSFLGNFYRHLAIFIWSHWWWEWGLISNIWSKHES